MNPLFLNTILLGGSSRDKIHAASTAGFAQIELWRQDVEAFTPGPEALRPVLADHHLGLTDYQVLLSGGSNKGAISGRLVSKSSTTN